MSISIDTSAIFDYAELVVSLMMPIIALSSGFGLGFRLVERIGKMFGGAI